MNPTLRRLVWWARRATDRANTWLANYEARQVKASERYCTFHGFVHPFDGVSDGAVCHRPTINAEEMRG